jgi:pyruvate/oxaloacetate carboxyltransferase
MLLRGQNLVGYRHYSDDIVRRFCHAAKRNGLDIFRCFDALNDARNLVGIMLGRDGYDPALHSP